MGSEEVTAADREKADNAVGARFRYRRTEDRERIAERVAYALAAERAKARVPFLALAEELDGQADEILARSPLAPYDHGRGLARASIARMIRRVAEDRSEVRET